MNKYAALLTILLLGFQYNIFPNPIDGTPCAKFSELTFDANNKWTMELYFYPRANSNSLIDSIIIEASGIQAKLLIKPGKYAETAVINTDSLSKALNINCSGDKIIINTYSTMSPLGGSSVRKDSIIFGNYPEATVDKPSAGYSIARVNLSEFDHTFSIDCLTKKTSLGAVNDTLNLTATLRGHIYDMNKKVITKLKQYYYFALEAPIKILGDGTYTTRIFQTLITPDHIAQRMEYFEGYVCPVQIEPFELNNIHPDTVYIRDIILKEDNIALTGVKNNIAPESEELTVINYPNPFNSSTNFFIKVPDRMKNKSGDIKIYNINGQIIKTIQLKNNTETANWDGRDSYGRIIPSGRYYYHLNIDNMSVRKGTLILLK
jgi:hypothetical protein